MPEIGLGLELGLELKLEQEQSERERELEQHLDMELDVEQVWLKWLISPIDTTYACHSKATAMGATMRCCGAPYGATMRRQLAPLSAVWATPTSVI